MAIAEYDDLDAVAMADLVRKREVTALELAEEAITRIEKLNPQLNAVVLKMYEHARETARSALPEGPFTGVPFLVKDMTSHYTGFPTTHGCKFLVDIGPSDHDTEIIKRFKKAGLVTVAKTSTPEFALSATTEPTFRGPAHNPWDLSRTPGGSSGGSSAAIAARIVPMAHGGDGGGSLRMPASCCGIVGFKPSRMRTPHGPDSSSLWESCCGEFAMTRSVRDSAYLLDAVSGQDVGAYYSAPPKERPYADEILRAPKKLRIAWSASGPTNVTPHPDCVVAVQHAAKLCADLGHHVEEATPRLTPAMLEKMRDSYLGMFAVETACDVDEMAALVGRTPTADDFEPANWALIERGWRYNGADAVRFKRGLHDVARAVGPFFEQYDIYLSPTVAQPPIPLGRLDPNMKDDTEYWNLMLEFMPFTALFNITGSAGVSLPLWWNAANLPIGVQFLSRMGEDGVLFQLASQLEKVQPWQHRKPPLIGG